MSLFADRVKTLRIAINATQKDVADALGITVRGYQFYEKATKEPTLSKLSALADFFDVSLDYLAGRTDNPKVNR